MRVVRAEATKLTSMLSVWIVVIVAIVATWLMSISNAAPLPEGISPDDPLLYTSEPIPVEYQGFEMVGFGYVLVVVAAALWAGSEYGVGGQLRTTFLAMPRRFTVFVVKSALIAVVIAVVAFVTMAGTIMITHAVAGTGVGPTLTAPIWAHILGVVFSWSCLALITFSVGCLTRSTIWPLVVVVPFVIGLGDFFATLWRGAAFLPVAAGSALYSDPASGVHLSPAVGAAVLAAWTVVTVILAATGFVRRDVP